MTRSSEPENCSEVQQLRCELEDVRRSCNKANETIERLRQQLVQAQETLQSVEGAASPREEQIKLLSEQLMAHTYDVQHERSLARSLQERLTSIWLPDIDGLSIAVDSRVSEQVGADFYEIIEMADGVVCIVIADVAGAGLQAALIMAMAKLAFRDASLHYKDPVAILEHVNSRLLDVTLERHYLTAFVGLLDPNTLQLQYVNASHCCPLLIHDAEIETLDSEGLFVGMFEEPHYGQQTVQVTRDDKLLLFTNGLLKAVGPGTCPDRSALETIIESCGEVPIGDIVARLIVESGEEFEDDITIVGIEVTKEPAEGRVIEISSIPSELMRVEKGILPVLADKGFSQRALFAIKLALEEAVINAMKHGNKMDPDKKVRVSFTLDNDRAKISIRDEGPGFNPGSIPNPTLPENLQKESGRGIMLMRAYLDDVYYNDDGTEVTLIKYAPWAEAEPSEST